MRWCLVFILALAAAEAADVGCPAACKCRWVSGRKAVECTNASLTGIPTNISSETQALDVSHNAILSLPADAFQSASLVNLHKLFLRHCSIEHVDSKAFSGLRILIELDLSFNKIATLSPFTFRDNSRLRQLYITHNPLQKLEDDLFVNLTFLLNVDLSECQLFHISQKTFGNVTKLNSLNLNNNNFTTMQVATLEAIPSLVNLPLFENPWRCDCRLKPFIEWTIRRNLYSRPTVCEQPAFLRGKLWTDLNAEDLSCRPRIDAPVSVVDRTGANATLPCKSSGNPLPDMHWVYNSRIITNSTQDLYLESKYMVSGSVDDDVRWLNLTVLGIDEDDVGEYTCVAQSYGGMEERDVNLVVRDVAAASGVGVVVISGAGFSLESWSLIIGLAVGGALALVLVVSLLAYCCVRVRRRRRALAVKSIGGGRLANGDALADAATQDEKFPLTAVNPVQKPPRRIERLSVTSAGTELTEIKSSLMDGGSVYQPSSIGDSEDRLEGRSIDSVDSNVAKSQDGLDTESVRSYAARPYPPDLLAFPARPQPPTTMPLHPYSTLPYSRSHSPLSMCSVPAMAVTRPQGYVTVPRRPRVPSWSSAGDPYFQKLNPVVYDNLGPRTTADGSSVLSLNKDPLPGHWDGRTRTSPEGSSTKKPAASRDHHAPENRYSVASVTSLGEGREKVPPRPPPKPRKKSMDIVAGPLFEDEEDDGTEV